MRHPNRLVLESWSTRRGSGLLTGLSLVAVVTACGGGGPPAPAPTPISPERATVERLLERSEVDAVVGGRARDFSRRVAIMAGDLTDDELERLVPAVREGFAPAAMKEDVASFLLGEGAPDTMDEVLSWLEEGAAAEVLSIAEGYEPELTLEEFAQSLTAEKVDGPRTRLFVDWARAQGAGDFYVLIDQALDEAAHKVWAAFREDAPAFTPLGGEALQMRLRTSLGAGVISFMYRYETVPDEVLRRATAEYATPAGQWYVESYSLAVATSIRAAGDRVVAAITGRAPSTSRGASRSSGAGLRPDTGYRGPPLRSDDWSGARAPGPRP